MGVLRSLILLQLVYMTICMDQLNIKYEWTQLDYAFQTPEDRAMALENKTFIPENNIPMGIEIFEDRLFVTVPRLKSGVPSTLNYIDLKDNSTNSPKLIPYPNWAAHTPGESGVPEIISPFRVRADRCNRLWVLDSGKIEENSTEFTPSLIIYDLKTDTLVGKYQFPKDQVKNKSSFANIVVEDFDCDNAYAFAGDVGKAGIVVYSWAKNDSLRVYHHYFDLDPEACNFSVKGVNFTRQDAISGLGLSAPNANNYSTLYFHPMASNDEFSVSTENLINATLAAASTTDHFDDFKLLGSRGPNAQSSVSFLDRQTGVLFYSLVNLNAVACWRTSNKEYNMKNQGRIYMNDVTMIYPTDIKVDYTDNLWILSNRLPIWMYKGLNATEVNFRIFSAPVIEAISHTACDVTPRSDILEKYVKNATIVPKVAERTEKTNDTHSSGNILSPVSLFAVLFYSVFIFTN